MYKAREFNIAVSRGENRFNLNALREHTSSARLNICAKGRNITIIKSSMKTTKQVARCNTHSVTYKKYTKLMTRLLVEYITQSRKSFPQKGSIRKILYSNSILLGKPSTNFNMKIISFGSYAMVYTRTTNTSKRRTIPSIIVRN